MTTQPSNTFSFRLTVSPTAAKRSTWQALTFGVALALAIPALATEARAQEPTVDPLPPAAMTTVTDDWSARVAQAEALLRDSRPSEALQVLEQASQQRQPPRLFLLKARAYRGLGMLPEARSHYQRYLTASEGSESHEAGERSQAEVEVRELNRIQQLTEAPRLAPSGGWTMPAGVSLVPMRVEHRKHHRGMLAAGISLLSIGYFPALVCGSTFLTSGGSSTEDKAFRTASGLLLLPVIGPLVSSIYAASAYRAETLLYWGLPWVLVDGALQATGLGLIIQGYRTPQKRVVLDTSHMTAMKSVRQLPEVRLSTMVLPAGGGLQVYGRF